MQKDKVDDPKKKDKTKLLPQQNLRLVITFTRAKKWTSRESNPRPRAC